MFEKYRIGVDIGGTNVKIALVDKKGEISFPKTVPTRAEMGYEYTVSNIIQTIKELIEEAKIEKSALEGIGFGFPGQIDCDNGIVRILPNIPGWINVPISEIMQKEFNVPVKVDNDVRCAALAELNYGAGAGCKNLICITVETGNCTCTKSSCTGLDEHNRHPSVPSKITEANKINKKEPEKPGSFFNSIFSLL